jgi:hypothetical protein
MGEVLRRRISREGGEVRPVNFARTAHHAAVKAAVAELKPIAHAEFAVALIEHIVEQAPFVVKGKSALPSTAAAELRGLVKALTKAAIIARNLSVPAIAELEQVRSSRGLEWHPVNGALRLPSTDLFGYPGLIEVAQEAAENIERNREKKGGRPRLRNQYALALAAVCAGNFETVTGTPAPISRSVSKFTGFVEAIFAIAGLAALSAEHYASEGAKAHRRQRERNSPEIWWDSRMV